MPAPIFLSPGESAMTINLNEKRPSCLILILLLSMPAVFCLGINMPAIIAGSRPTPTATMTHTVTITPTPTFTSTGTITPRPSATRTPTPSATRPLNEVGYVAQVSSSTPTITPTETITPTATPCLLYYRVKVGDNLSTIASRYRLRTSAILGLNSIPNPNLLYVGRVLKIPACLATPAPTATRPEPSSTSEPSPTVWRKFNANE